MNLTRRQMLELEKLAESKNTTVGALIDGEFAEVMADLLKSRGR
jgi:hypothetical protein